MKIAAIQMMAEFADVEANLKIAKRLATQAFTDGAEWVILPEFFTSAMGYQKKMLDIAMPIDDKPMQLLNDLAIKYNGVVGGSFIALRGNESYNTFVLAFPDGNTYFHDKDQPTMWENCYYIGGKDDGVLETTVGNIGVALCWEFVRTRTVRRLLDRVNMVVGGSCWWTIPKEPLQGFTPDIHEWNVEIMSETPARFARLLGVPVVHAAHAGDFECETPLVPDFSYKSYYLGETQIVDGSGKILARLRREDGEGIIMTELDLTKKWKPSEPIPDGFWIPELPPVLNLTWQYLNKHGEKYYRTETKPYREKHQ
ncbi:MAG: carbon-nitrogen hydrolase family protein [Candidatus Helarchaeota archaeon]|nr:carbon-nitrogen hydrolase family protein [Candidatus Helarchaeota archaeon]